MRLEERQFQSLSALVGAADRRHLRTAVDTIINKHQPIRSTVFDHEDCPEHGPDNPHGYRSSRLVPGLDRADGAAPSCPTCRIYTAMVCGNGDCLGAGRDWPCAAVEALCGDLDVNLGDAS